MVLDIGIDMHHMQDVHTAIEPNEKYPLMPTVITPKFESTSNCLVPKCMSHELAHAKKHSHQVVQQKMIKISKLFKHN